jgi:rod shape determining protein RodA
LSRSWRDYNWFLFGSLIVLIGFSLALVYSATLKDPSTSGYFSRHLVNLIIGGVAMALLTALDYHALQAWTRPIYLAIVTMLAAVLMLGQIRGGAQSWIDLGRRTFQPSEAAKLLIVVALAAYFARFEKESGATRVQLGGLLLAGLPIGLVFIQPDFGTAMVLSFIWFMIAWTAGLRWWQLALLLAAAIPVGYIGWTRVLDPEQQSRILVFLDPLGYDPQLQNGAWNIMQALNAIGSGGLTGRGWTHGPLTQGSYIPVQYSDFIFATSGEELGFIGSTILLLFEGVLIWQALAVAGAARDSFGRLIAVGIAAMSTPA